MTTIVKLGEILKDMFLLLDDHVLLSLSEMLLFSVVHLKVANIAWSD